jgi:hypothetical protein
MHSNLQFLIWPGIAAGIALHSLVPEFITVQYDPLPHPLVLWGAWLINILVWLCLFGGSLAFLRSRVKKQRA